jgi:hypothetical protein
MLPSESTTIRLKKELLTQQRLREPLSQTHVTLLLHNHASDYYVAITSPMLNEKV